MSDFYRHVYEEVTKIIEARKERDELRRRYASYLPKHEGCDCSKWEVVKRYLDTPFPYMTGNGNSSSWLYGAIQTCIKYNDDKTLEEVIAKARREGWTSKEIEAKMK